MDSPIYFANASYIKSRLYAWADLNNLISRWKEQHRGEDPADSDTPNKEDFAYANNLAINTDDEDDAVVLPPYEPSRERRRQSLLSSISSTFIQPIRRNSVQAINMEDFG